MNYGTLAKMKKEFDTYTNTNKQHIIYNFNMLKAEGLTDRVIEQLKEEVYNNDAAMLTNRDSYLNRAVDTVKQYLGVPYVWGGTTPSGFDCSGLVQYVYGQIGVNISRTTYTQVNEGRYVSRDELLAGDLVFFGDSSSPHHVGMYIGDGMMIHAPQTGDVVKIASLSARSDYATARRIVE